MSLFNVTLGLLHLLFSVSILHLIFFDTFIKLSNVFGNQISIFGSIHFLFHDQVLFKSQFLYLIFVVFFALRRIADKFIKGMFLDQKQLSFLLKDLLTILNLIKLCLDLLDLHFKSVCLAHYIFDASFQTGKLIATLCLDDILEFLVADILLRLNLARYELTT